MANVAVNATISARDAASGNINKVNKSLKALQFGFAAAGVAAAALAKFAFDAVRAAAEDEMSNARLNAALKARGFLTTDLAAKIKEQTLAMAALGITDDQVRAGIEVGSRFFADQTTILEANTVAADVAAVTGQSLADVVTLIGKGAQGQLKGLRALGIQVNKGATAQDILTAISAKYSGVASEIADTTGGKYLSAQVNLNEKMEEFGYMLLPAVNEALGFMTESVLPALETQFSRIGVAIDKVTEDHFNPLQEELDRLSLSFGGMEGFLDYGSPEYWDRQFKGMRDALDAARIAIKIFNDSYEFMLRLLGKPIPGEGGAINPMDIKYGPDLQVPNPYSDPNTTVVTTVNIGTEKVDTVVAQSIRRIGVNPRQQ
jgi:hypothetical protein